MRKKVDIVDILIAFIICALVIYIFTTSKYFTSIAGDIGDSAYALWGGIATTLNKGELPLWSPYLWGGFSSIGQMMIQSFYPVTLILCKIFFNEATGMLSYNMVNVYQIIHIIILCISLYVLLRVLDFKKITCFSICLVGTFSFTILQTSSWIVFFSGFAWIPLILALSILFMRNSARKGWLYCILAGLSLGISGLANPGPTLLINILMFGFLFFFYAWEYKKEKYLVIQLFYKSIITGIIGMGLCSIVLLPSIQFSGLASRFVPGVGQVEGLEKMPLQIFTEHSATNFNLNGLLNGAGQYGWLSIGMTMAIFLIFGFFIKKKGNKPVYYFAQFSFGFTLCYSIAFIFTDIMYYIPFYNAIREPVLYTPYIGVTAAIMAGYGMDTFFQAINQKFNLAYLKETFYNVPFLVMVLLISIIFFLVPHNLGKVNIIGVVLLILFFVQWIIRNKRKSIQGTYIILSLIIISTTTVDIIDFKNTFSSYNYSPSEAQEKVDVVNKSIKKLFTEDDRPNESDPYRIASWGDQAYPNSIAGVLGFYDITGYLNPMYTKSVFIHNNIDLTKRVQLQNIKYFMHTEEADDNFKDWFKAAYPSFTEVKRVEEVYASYNDIEPKTVVMYETSNRLGAGWLVYDIQEYTSDTTREELAVIINNPEFDLAEVALVNKDTVKDKTITLEGKGKVSEVKLTSYKTNSISLEVSTDKPALLVMAESDYPGWKAYVNGKATEIVEVNYANKGIVLESGDSSIEFKYVPTMFIGGMVLIIVSIVICITILILVFMNKKDSANQKAKR